MADVLDTTIFFHDELTKIAVSSEWGAKRIIGGMASRLKDVTPKNFDPAVVGPRIADAMGTTTRFAAHQLKRGKKFGSKMLDAAVDARPDFKAKMEAIEKAKFSGPPAERKALTKEMRKGVAGKEFSAKGIEAIDRKGGKKFIRKVRAAGGVVR